MAYLDSFLCMYMVQSVLHAVITLFLVEMSLKIWEIQDPRECFRYRLHILVLPLLMFPLFQLANPNRGSLYFIEDTAIFSSFRWLSILLWGKIPFYVLFICIMVLTSLLTIVQEIMTVLRNIFNTSSEEIILDKEEPEVSSVVSEISKIMNIEKPAVHIVDDDNNFIYTRGIKDNDIIISDSFFKKISKGELRSVLAHECAHIVRRSSLINLAVFFVRMLMFYNPVSMIVFRRMIQDDELICDEMTVSITKDPKSLSSALKAFYSDIPEEYAFNLSTLKDTVANSSHNLLLEERISRLENRESLKPSAFQWGGLTLLRVAVCMICYLVV